MVTLQKLSDPMIITVIYFYHTNDYESNKDRLMLTRDRSGDYSN